MEKRNFRREGADGEELAARYLRERGYTIVEQNFRFSRMGEIDIIARDGEYLVFCEVKTRKNEEYGPPEYAVTSQKQNTIRRIAGAYLYLRGITGQACRFDGVTIRFEGETPRLTLIQNAF